MDVELNEDEEEIRTKLATAQLAYKRAFALLVAERLLDSLKSYLPQYWHISAEDAIKEAWLCLQADYDDAHFVHCCKKLHAEEIGMHENPVINHVMKAIDLAIGFFEEKNDLDEVYAELHHMVRVVEKTAKNPELASTGIANEKDYLYSIAELIIKSDQNQIPTHDQLAAQLKHPSTTLFGTPDDE
jgi:hypothetical protein